MNKHLAKRIISICLVVIMSIANAAPAVSAADYEIERYDDNGYEGPVQGADAAVPQGTDGAVSGQQGQAGADADTTHTDETGETGAETGEAGTDGTGGTGAEANGAGQADAAPAKVSLETLPELPGNVFDLQQSPVSIYDAEGGRCVEYGGVAYATTEKSFVFTGSTNANRAIVQTDSEIEIRLQDLTMDANEALTFFGKGVFDVIVEGTVVLGSEATDLFLSGSISVNLQFEDKSVLIAAGDIGATEDMVPVSVNGGFISARNLFTGSDIIVNGGSILGNVYNAKAGDGTPVYPVYLADVPEGFAYSPAITVNGAVYTYGWFYAGGQVCLYLPEGDVSVTVGNLHYIGRNTSGGVILEPEQVEPVPEQDPLPQQELPSEQDLIHQQELAPAQDAAAGQEMTANQVDAAGTAGTEVNPTQDVPADVVQPGELPSEEVLLPEDVVENSSVLDSIPEVPFENIDHGQAEEPATEGTEPASSGTAAESIPESTVSDTETGAESEATSDAERMEETNSESVNSEAVESETAESEAAGPEVTDETVADPEEEAAGGLADAAAEEAIQETGEEVGAAILASAPSITASAETGTYTGDVTVALQMETNAGVDTVEGVTELTFPDGTIVEDLHVEDNRVVNGEGTVYLEPAGPEEVTITDVTTDAQTICVSTQTQLGPDMQAGSLMLHGGALAIETTDPVYSAEDESVAEETGMEVGREYTEEELAELGVENGTELIKTVYPDMTENDPIHISTRALAMDDGEEVLLDPVSMDLPVVLLAAHTVAEFYADYSDNSGFNTHKAEAIHDIMQGSHGPGLSPMRNEAFLDNGVINFDTAQATVVGGNGYKIKWTNRNANISDVPFLSRVGDTVIIFYPKAATITYRGVQYQFPVRITWTSATDTGIMFGYKNSKNLKRALIWNEPIYFNEEADATNNSNAQTTVDHTHDGQEYYVKGDLEIMIPDSLPELQNAKWQLFAGDMDPNEYFAFETDRLFSVLHGSKYVFVNPNYQKEDTVYTQVMGNLSDNPSGGGTAWINQSSWVIMDGSRFKLLYGNMQGRNTGGNIQCTTVEVQYYLTDNSDVDKLGPDEQHKISKEGSGGAPIRVLVPSMSLHTTLLPIQAFISEEDQKNYEIKLWGTNKEYYDAEDIHATPPGEIYGSHNPEVIASGALGEWLTMDGNVAPEPDANSSDAPRDGIYKLYAEVKGKKWQKPFQKLDSESVDGSAPAPASLQGAVYELRYGDPQGENELVDTYTTDRNGQFTIGPFIFHPDDIGKYYLREITASEGYLVNPEITVVNLPNTINNDLETLAVQDLPESIKRNNYPVSKTTHVIGGDTGHTSVGGDPVKGAGFTVYDAGTLGEAYGVTGIDAWNNEDIAAWVKNTILDDPETHYEALLQKGVVPATVSFKDGTRPATEFYQQYYGVNQGNVNEFNGNYGINPAGTATFVKSYTYKRYKADGTMENVKTISSNDYFAAEFFTNEGGAGYTALLPYGKYVLIETTTPYGKMAADPVAFDVTDDSKDGTIEGDGDGSATKPLNGFIEDTAVAARIRITKRSTVNAENNVVRWPGAKFLIYEKDGLYAAYLAEKSGTTDKAAFVESYKTKYYDASKGWLVVYLPDLDVNTTNPEGSINNPFTYKTKEQDDWVFQTPMLVPQGTYTIMEVAAPDGFVLRGHEEDFRVNPTTNQTFWEVEDPTDTKWNQFANKPTANDKGVGVSNDAMATNAFTQTLTIDETNPEAYDFSLGEYYTSANWKDDPAVGKISIYVEGEQLTGMTDGNRVADRVGANFNGYTAAEGSIEGQAINSGSFRNHNFTWTALPVGGVEFTITAADDIPSPNHDGNLFNAGDQVGLVLTTDANGKAHTNTIQTRMGLYKGLPMGSYLVTMHYPEGSGFVDTEANRTRLVTISQPDETVSLVFKDEAYLMPRKKMELAIGKYDAVTGQVLDGAVFALVTKTNIYDKDGNILLPAKTVVALSETSDGKKATFPNVDLPLGEYYVCEFSAPIGYTTSTQTWDIGTEFAQSNLQNIDPEQAVYSYKNTGFKKDYSFENTPIGIYIRLSDYFTDVELNGGKFDIIDDQNTVVVSDFEPVANGENLVFGLHIGKTYTIRQKEAPEGYVNETLIDNRRELPFDQKDFSGNAYPVYRLNLDNKSATEVTFTVQDQNAITDVIDQNAVQVVNLQNRPILGKIRITKKGKMPMLSADAGTDPAAWPDINSIIEGKGGKSIIPDINEDIYKLIKQKFPEFAAEVNQFTNRNITDIPIDEPLQGLAGAEYKIELVGDIQYPDGVTQLPMMDKKLVTHDNGVKTFVTDTDGTVLARQIDGMVTQFHSDELADGLLPGTYKITEVKAPRGYALETGTAAVVRYITITQDGVVMAADYTNPLQKMDMHIYKTILADGKPFAEPNPESAGQLSYGVYGATFVLIALNDIYVANQNENRDTLLIGKGTIVDIKSTDANGRIDWRADLPIGDYAAFEIGVPKGYYKYRFGTDLDDIVYYYGEQYKDDSSVKTVSVTADKDSAGMTDDISVIKLFLRDLDNEHELATAQFRILDKNGNPVGKTLIINGNRMTTVSEDVEGGSGFITEVTDGTAHKIYGLEPGETYQFVEVKPREDYTYTIYTKDEDGNPVDTDGVVYKNGLPDELSDDNHNTNVFTYTVPTDKSVDTITLYNKRVVGEITLSKVGDILMGVRGSDQNFTYDDLPLTGAKFSLFAQGPIVHPDGIVGVIYNDGDLVYQDVTLDADGHLHFSVPYEGTEVDNDGKITFGNLYMGTYLIREIEFPDGFVIHNDDEYELDDRTVTIGNRGPAQPVVNQSTVINNERQRVRINVQKIDAETKQPVHIDTSVDAQYQAEYRLYGAEDIRAADGAMLVYKDGQIGDPITLDANGFGTFVNTDPDPNVADDQWYLDLPLGHYYVEETRAPYGYALPNYTPEELENRRLTRVTRRVYIDATYDEDGRREIVVTAPFENDPVRVAFDVLDYNNENIRLDGTKLRITGENLPQDGIEVTVGKDGFNPVFTGVFTPGVTYKIKEEQPVENYGATVYRKERDVFTTPYADANHPDGYSDGTRTYKPVVTGLVLSAGGTDSVGDIDLATQSKTIATFTVEHTAGVQVMTLFNKKNPVVTFDALDLDTKEQHLFGTEIEISGGDLTSPIPITISPEGTNPVLKNLTAGVTYTLTEKKPVYGYGNTIYGVEGFHSPFEENLNGYSDGTEQYQPVSSVDIIPMEKNVTKFTVEQRDGVQVVTIFNTVIRGTITGHKEGEVAKSATIGNDGNADVVYEFLPLEGVEYELYANERIYSDLEKTQLLYEENQLVGSTTTDADGNFRFETLPIGKYYVTEKQTLYGLVRSRERFEVNLNEVYETAIANAATQTDDYNAEVTYAIPNIKNKRVRVDIGVPPTDSMDPIQPGGDPMHDLSGKAGIEKYGVMNEELALTDDLKERVPLEGVEFTVYTNDVIRNINGQIIFQKNAAVAKAVTGADGRAIFDVDLPVGSYYIKETEHKTGYTHLGEDTVYFDTDEALSEDEEHKIQILRYRFELDNTPVHVAFDVLDYNNEDIRLDGTKLKITGDDIEPIDVTVGKDGFNPVFTGLFTPGVTYKIEEVESVEDYGPTVYRKGREVFTTPYADENHPDGYSDGTRTYKPVITGNVLSAGGTDSVGDIDLATTKKTIATFTVEQTAGVQVITVFNKKNPVVTFDALDLDTKEQHLYGTEIEISGGDLTEPIPVTISPEGTNPVLKGLTAGVTYTLTEKKPVYGYGNTIYGVEGFHSPFEENLDGYSDGTTQYQPVSSVDIIPMEKNVTKFTVEQRDGIQVITIFNTVIRGTITGHKEGEVAKSATIGNDGNADVVYEFLPLEGVEYELYANERIYSDLEKTQLLYEENQLVGSTTTDADGNFRFETLPIGKYYVTEKQTLYGLVRSRERFEVNLNAVYETAIANAATQTDDYNAEVTYAIPDIKNKRVRVDIGVPPTDDMDPIQPGGDPMHDLSGKAGIEKYGITHEDLQLTDNLKNRVPLEGVEFTVYTNDVIRNLNDQIIFQKDVAVAKAVTDANGRAIFDVDLPVGSYYIKETAYKAGYTPIEEDTVYFNTDEMLAADEEHKIQILRYRFKMDNIRSEVRVTLKDLLTHNELAGAKFKIVDEEGRPVEGLYYNDVEGNIHPLTEEGYTTWVTNDTGTSIYGLTPGETYKIIETQPKPDYSYNLYGEDKTPLGRHDKLNEYVFTVPENTDIYRIDLYNKFVVADLTFKKELESFTITTQDSDIIFTYTVDDVMRDIQFRLVATENIEHPDGKTGILYHNGTEDVVRMNVDQYDDWTQAPEAIGTTNGDGYGYIQGLFLGKYKLVEIESPEGFVGNEPIELNLTAAAGNYGDERVPVVVTEALQNMYQKVNINLVKTDPITGNGIAGAEYTLYSYSTIVDKNGKQHLAGQPIEVKTTNQNGKIAFSTQLPVGYKYYIKETATPDGYLLSDEEHVIDALYIPTDIKTKEVKIETEDNPIRLQINLMDVDTEVELEDATITIYDKDGTPVYQYHTKYNDNPILTPADFPFEEGETYTIEVTQPRKGYTNEIITKDDYSDTDVDPTLLYGHVTASFPIGSTPEVQVVNIFATPVKALVRIHKEGNFPKTTKAGDHLTDIVYETVGLPDAEYVIEPKGEIIHPDGHTPLDASVLAQTLVTDENGDAVTATPLPLGLYTITETKAPRGYVRDRNATDAPFSIVRDVDLREDYVSRQYNHEQYAVEITDDHTVDFLNKMQIVDIGDDDTPLPDPEEDPTGDIYLQAGLIKTDHNGEPVTTADAEFDLFTEEPIILGGRVAIDEHVLVAHGRADNTGRIRFTFPGVDNVYGRISLPVGRYYAVETKAPYGYYPLSEDVKIHYTTEDYENNDVVKIIRLTNSVPDIPTKVVLTVQDDRTYEYLDDVTFHIIDKETGDTVVENFTTIPTQTEYVFEGVFDPGHDYVVIEDKPRTDYTYIIRDENREPIYDLEPGDENRLTFHVPDTETDGTTKDIPDTIEVHIYNEFIVGSVTVAKTADELVDATNGGFAFEQLPKDGITFGLYAGEDGIRHPDGWTNKDGRKPMADGEQGYIYEPNQQITTAVTDHGTVTFSELMPGTYYILEEGQYEGYAYGTEESRRYDFSIHADDDDPYRIQRVTADKEDPFVNIRQKVRILVNKLDVETGEHITETPAHFVLSADGTILRHDTHETLYEDNETVDEQDTNDEGIAIFENNVFLHTYWLQETQAPVGYVLDDTPIHVDARYLDTGEPDFTVTVDVNNEQTKTVICVLDDNYNTQLADTQLSLYEKDGDDWVLVRDLTTSETGTEILRGLKPGVEYKVVETQPRYGYKNEAIRREGYKNHDYDNFGYDPITDLPLDGTEEHNEVIFVTENKGGLQVVTIFNKPVMTDFIATKIGELPKVTYGDVDGGVVDEIEWIGGQGLDGAVLELRAAEDIVYPDGMGRVMYSKDTVVETLTTGVLVMDKGDQSTEAHGVAQTTKPLYLGHYILEEKHAPRGYSRDITNGNIKSIHDLDLRNQYEVNLYDDAQYNSDMALRPETASAAQILTFENPRQGIDVGGDNPEGIDVTNPEGDPEQGLRYNAGVYKYGVDPEGNEIPVDGAVFELRAAALVVDTNGNVVFNENDLIETVTTGDPAKNARPGQGVFTTLLPVGKYKVTEVDAPKGYYSSDKTVYFDTADYENNDLVQMIRFRGEIVNPVTRTIITLQDWVTDVHLKDAIFQIIDPETGEVVEDVYGNPAVWTTDGTEHVIDGLDPEKEYIIEETKPREGYSYIIRDEDGNEIHNVTEGGEPQVNKYAFTIPDTQVHEDLGNAPEPYEVHLFNQYVTANVFVTKTGELIMGVDATGDFQYEDFNLQNAEFTIYVVDDIYHPDGETGLIMRGGETVAVTVDTAGAHIARMNVLERNADGSFGDEAIAVTETDGIAKFLDLFMGHYVIRETKTIPGYATNFQDTEFTVQYDADKPWQQHIDNDSEYHNERQKIHLTVIKHDLESGKLLKDTTFGLYIAETVYNARGVKLYDADPDDPDTWPLIETQTTGEDGKAVFTVDIPQAHYVIRELAVPKGYILNHEVIDIDGLYKDDVYDTPESQDYVFDYNNEETKVIVDVLDIDTHEIINDTHLTLKDWDGNPVPGYEDIVLDDENHLIIRGLEPGKMYYFDETEPGYGFSNEVFVQPGYESVYVKNGLHERYNDFDEAHDLVDYKESRNVVSFVVTEDGGLQVVTIFNERTKATLTITKSGEMPEVTFTDDRDVESISYSVKGLMGAEYDLLADDNIEYPYKSGNIVYHKGDKIGHYTTDINGKVVITGLYVGKYRVVETKAPKGYVRIQQDSFLEQVADFTHIYEESIRGNGINDYENGIELTVAYENPRQIVDIGNDYTDIPNENLHGDPNYRLYLKTGVYKRNESDGTGVANAQFTLYTDEPVIDNHGVEVIPKDTKVETSWTDDDGRAVFTNFDLPIGRYYVVEDNAPNGYYGSSKVAIFDTADYDTNDEVQVIRLDNSIENKPVIVKIFLRDVITDVELKDASLHVEDENGETIASWLTEDTEGKGYVLNAQVVPGVKYTITEPYAREGYTNIIRDTDGNPIHDKETPNQYTFRVEDLDGYKEDADEIVINLYNLHIAGFVRIHKSGDILTDYDELGFTYENDNLERVRFAIYAAEDIFYPDGVTGPDGTTAPYSNGTQIPLFKKGELVRMNTHINGGVDAIIETDLNGIAIAEGLYPGKYEVREYENVEGYARPKWKGPVYFTIAPEDTSTQHVEAKEGLINYKNKRQLVKIQLTKLDTDSKKPIEGVEFGLYTAEDIYNSTSDFLLDKDQLITSAVTDENGFAAFNDSVPAGHYYIKETKPAEGYLPNEDVIEVDATWKEDGREVQTLRYTVYNQITRIRIRKLDENGEILGDAHLALYDADGNKIKDFNTSEGCPFYTVEGLTPGAKYILKEEEPAPGYTTAKYKCFRVQGRNEDGTYEPQVVEMVDEPTHIQVSVIEDNPQNTKERLANVDYHIEDMAGETVIIGGTRQQYTSLADEDIDIWKIPIGTYRLVVDRVPDGYLVPEPQEIQVLDSPDLQKFVIPVPYTKIEIAAVDKETGKVLQKTQADIMDDSGRVVMPDQPLGLEQDRVSPGNYLIHITQGPSGYLPQDEDAKITVEETPELQKFIVELDHTRVLIRAVDQETGKRINGVKIDLINKNDIPVAYDTALDYKSDYVPSGQYTVKTVRVPEQYMAPADMSIYVRQTPGLQVFEIPMYRVRAAIRAVDVSTNIPVRGVKLKLRARDGSVYASWTTQSGWKLFRPIMPGTYMLQPVSVPPRYNFPKAETIVIQDLPDIQYFELKLIPKEHKGCVINNGCGYYSGSAASAAGSAAAAAAASKASTKTAVGSPATGDDLNLIWLFMALACEIILAAVLIRRKRKLHS